MVIPEKLRSLFRTICFKLLHPTVKAQGFHMVRPGTEIVLGNGGKLTLGSNVNTFKRVTLAAVGGKLTIGSHISFNRNDIIACVDEVTIGSGCFFGPNVVIYDHDHIFSAEGFSKTGLKTAPVVIEPGCWIGAGVTILRGTHIGEGCVIGAGTIVKGNIPAHSLVRSDRGMKVEPIGRKEPWKD